MTADGVGAVQAFLMQAFPDPSPEGDDAVVVEMNDAEFRVTVTRTSVDEVVTRVEDDEETAYRRRCNRLLHKLGYGGQGLLLVGQARAALEEFVADEVARVRRRDMTEALGERR